MPAQRHVFTSESVTEGHPDKIADQISDAVLDAIIAKDPAARVACETLVTTGMAVVAGEITTSTYVHIPDIVRGTISAIGYTDASFGFEAQRCPILTTIDRQPGHLALGVGGRGAGGRWGVPWPRRRGPGPGGRGRGGAGARSGVGAAAGRGSVRATISWGGARRLAVRVVAAPRPCGPWRPGA